MESHWLLRSSLTALSASARRLTMASVGEFDGLWAIFVPPGASGETLLAFGSAPLAMDGPR